MKKTNNDRYKHLNASRYAEIQILLKKDLNNYANLTPVEKLNHHVIRLVVSNPDFNVELFPDEVLNDKEMMIYGMVYDSNYFSSYKAKITSEEEAMKTVVLKCFKEKHLGCLSNELTNNKRVISYLIYNKPYFFKSLNKEIKEDKEINAIYMNSEYVQWEHMEDINKTSKNAQLVVAKSLDNLSDVIVDFPRMKNKVKTLESIAKYFKNSQTKMKPSYLTSFNNTFNLNNQDFVKLFNDMQSDIPIYKKFIELIKKSKYSNLCENIQLNELENNVDVKDILKRNIREIIIKEVLKKKEESLPKMERTKAKI